jgi:hypothetical protein
MPAQSVSDDKDNSAVVGTLMDPEPRAGGLDAQDDEDVDKIFYIPKKASVRKPLVGRRESIRMFFLEYGFQKGCGQTGPWPRASLSGAGCQSSPDRTALVLRKLYEMEVVTTELR